VYKGKNLDPLAPAPPPHRRDRHYHGNVTDRDRHHKGTIADVTDTLKVTHHRRDRHPGSDLSPTVRDIASNVQLLVHCSKVQ
jgi:hypothetical protein